MKYFHRRSKQRKGLSRSLAALADISQSVWSGVWQFRGVIQCDGRNQGFDWDHLRPLARQVLLVFFALSTPCVRLQLSSLSEGAEVVEVSLCFANTVENSTLQELEIRAIDEMEETRAPFRSVLNMSKV